MKMRRLSNDESVKWCIFLTKDAPHGAKVIEQIENWGIGYSEILDDAVTFDSEKEALEMKETLDKVYPFVKQYGYIDCVMSYHNDGDPKEQLNGWIEWWSEYGSKWYMDNGYPQDQKPPALKSEHELYIGYNYEK